MTKEDIIREIKRTAQANGGVPLGQRRFQQETGIRVHDWNGKHWARWSDAIIEAGLAPNKLTSAIDETILLEKYISLVRELKHLPVEGELRLKARGDKSFPNGMTYYNRFGSKQGLVTRLAAYCAGREQLKDIASLCNGYLANTKEQNEDDRVKSDRAGYVYLLKMGRSFKIGKTFNPVRREGQIILQLPEKCEPIHYIENDDPSGIENYWHRRFAEKRQEGEWFSLTTEDVRAFKRWRRIY